MVVIPFVRDHPIIHGQAERLSPLITRVTADNPGPFTYAGTGVYIVGTGTGTDTVAVIDPGPITPAHTKAMDVALAGKTVSHVLLTHHHADHSPMAVPLAAQHGCQIFGCAPRPAKGEEVVVKLEEGVDESFAPHHSIADGDVFSGPDWTLHALHTPGHTSNHICFALVEENALFSGDHIMGWATSVVIPPDGHMGDYLNSLDRVLAAGFATIYPTHGPAITDADPFVRAYIAHRYAREDDVAEALKSGHSNVMDIVRHIYTHIDKRLYPAAAMSVLSHLIHMCETGRAQCEGSGKDNMTLNGTYLPR